MNAIYAWATTTSKRSTQQTTTSKRSTQQTTTSKRSTQQIIYIHTCVTYIHVYVYTYIHTYMCMYIHIYIHTCACIYTYTYIHVYVYTSIHTHIIHTHMTNVCNTCLGDDDKQGEHTVDGRVVPAQGRVSVHPILRERDEYIYTVSGQCR